MMGSRLSDISGVQRDVLLAGFSTFGVGGSADYFYELRQAEMLPELLEAARAESLPWFVLGGGSNVLFADTGFRGLIVRVRLEEIEVKGDRLVAGAGVKWPALLAAAETANLSGMEAMSGLPGTLGGAVVGNAGCFGTETADLVESVELLDPATGAMAWVDRDFFEFRYRWSRLKEDPRVVLRARLKLHAGAPSGPTAQEILALRLTKQPPGKTGGSFFKNPSPEQTAGQLIDACGLKGLRVGGAQISPKHANFFMNAGGATTSDFLALRDRAQAAVREKFGVELQPEVVLVEDLGFSTASSA